MDAVDGRQICLLEQKLRSLKEETGKGRKKRDRRVRMSQQVRESSSWQSKLKLLS